MAHASRHTEPPQVREIHLTLTPSEFTALRDHFDPSKPDKVVGTELENVVIKLLEIDARLSAAQRIARTFSRHD